MILTVPKVYQKFTTIHKLHQSTKMPAESPKKRTQPTEKAPQRVTRSKTAQTANDASQGSRERTVPIFESLPERNENDSSELSESSEDPSSDSSSDEDSEDGEKSHEDSDDAAVPKPAKRKIINVRSNRGEKPIMKLPEEDTDIRAFLKDFLPKLKAANEELEAERKAGTLEKKKIEVDDGAEDGEGEHIEMVSLFLGK